jgi:hypothetical protein
VSEAVCVRSARVTLLECDCVSVTDVETLTDPLIDKLAVTRDVADTVSETAHSGCRFTPWHTHPVREKCEFG